jgi:hypothetical protein
MKKFNKNIVTPYVKCIMWPLIDRAVYIFCHDLGRHQGESCLGLLYINGAMPWSRSFQENSLQIIEAYYKGSAADVNLILYLRELY